MTHEEQIKWMSDRIAYLETQYKSAMKNTATLMGLLGTKRPWVGLTEEEQIQVAFACGCMSADWLDFARAIEAKLKELNT